MNSRTTDQSQLEIKMNAEIEQIQAKRQSAKESYSAKKQRISTLKETIYSLNDASHSQRMSLFISLFILRVEQQTEFEKLRALLSDHKIDAAEHILHQFNLSKGWINYKTQVNDEIIDSHLKGIQSLQNAATQVVQRMNLSQDKAENLLYEDLHEIIQKDAKYFGFQTFDWHTRLVIKTIMHGFGFKDGMTLYDGAAKTGFLATDLCKYMSNCKLGLEEENSDSYILGQQLQSLKNTQKNIRFVQNNAKSGKSKLTYGQADFYVSFPQIPNPLTQAEANVSHDFLALSRSGKLSRNASDALWVQYALQCLTPKGIAFIAVQDGFLRRPGYDLQLRQYLVEHQFIDMVIHINNPEHISNQYNNISILVLNKAPKKHSHDIKLIDLRAGLPRHPTVEEEINAIEQLTQTDQEIYQNFVYIGQIPDVRIDISHQQLVANNYNLTFSNYKDSDKGATFISLEEAQHNYEKAQQQVIQASERFEEIINQLQSMERQL